MDKPTSDLSAETIALKETYLALNRNDIQGFLEIFDPQVERIEPPDFPGAGTHHGIEALREHVSHHRGNWAEGACEPERFVAAANRIVVLVRVRVRLKDETEWREGRIGDVFTFRNGKATQFRTFVSFEEALEWAGAKA